jgi:hypothetical protein
MLLEGRAETLDLAARTIDRLQDLESSRARVASTAIAVNAQARQGGRLKRIASGIFINADRERDGRRCAKSTDQELSAPPLKLKLTTLRLCDGVNTPSAGVSVREMPPPI